MLMLLLDLTVDMNLKWFEKISKPGKSPFFFREKSGELTNEGVILLEAERVIEEERRWERRRGPKKEI